jgi:hypothetical protein
MSWIVTARGYIGLLADWHVAGASSVAAIRHAGSVTT